jgi:hypothetical protein
MDNQLKPAKLGKNRLLSLAMVMKEIKDQIDNDLTERKDITAQVELDTTNIYFWSRDDCFGKGDTGHSDHLYSKDDLKRTWLEMLDYLRGEGVIVGIDMIKESKEASPPIESFVDYDYFGPWYFVRVIQPGFDNLYSTVISRAQPFVGKADEALDEISIDEQILSKPAIKISLELRNKQLKLFVEGKPKAVIKDFKGANLKNATALKTLLNFRGTYRSKEEMNIGRAKSAVRHLPKTMGIKGQVADQFMMVDSANQKLQIRNNVIVTPQELKELINYIKQNPDKK